MAMVMVMVMVTAMTMAVPLALAMAMVISMVMVMEMVMVILHPSGMYVLGTLIFASFARGEVQPFNFVTFNQGNHISNMEMLGKGQE